MQVDAGRALAKKSPLDLWSPEGGARVILASGLGATPKRRSLAIAPGLWHMSFALRGIIAGAWRRGREAEGDGLLNRYRGNPIVGSNPTVSASQNTVLGLLDDSVDASPRRPCSRPSQICQPRPTLRFRT